MRMPNAFGVTGKRLLLTLWNGLIGRQADDVMCVRIAGHQAIRFGADRRAFATTKDVAIVIAHFAPRARI